MARARSASASARATVRSPSSEQERVRVHVMEQDGHGVAVGDGEGLRRERLQLALEPAATGHDTRGVEEAERDEAVRHRRLDDSAVGSACLSDAAMAAASPSNRR